MRVTHCLMIGMFLLPCAACGGSQSPAEEPSSEASDSNDASESASSEASDDADKKDSEDKDAASSAEAKEEKSKDSSSESSAPPKVTRTPKDILTAPDVLFMFSFNESDMKVAAEERCDQKVKNDPKKRADCMSKAKEKIPADGMGFKQEKGKWYWMTIRRKGKTLVNLHKIPVEFENETETSVVLKPVGKDEGTQRGKGPGETKVEVPNDYQIVIKDPTHGKMVYEAKIGLTGEAAQAR